MIGDVKTRAQLEGEVNTKATLIGDISTKCTIGEVRVGRVIVEHYETEEYDGEYVITPSAEAQSLETANKRMVSDLEIQAIPYYDVSNEYGRTIYIGGDI